MEEKRTQGEFVDLYRAGLRNAVELMKASLESARRLHEEQLSSLGNALEQNERCLRELEAAESLEALVALQQKVAGAQFERAMGYWGELYRNAGQTQAAAAGRQMAQAKQWFEQSYELASRAAQEAARLPGGALTPGPRSTSARTP